VPKERVFLCGEYAYTGKVIQYFTSIYRACIGACVAGQGDVMIGAGVLMARANGLSAKTFAPKFIEMAVNNETTFTMGVGSIALGAATRPESGFPTPSPLTPIKFMSPPYPMKPSGSARRSAGDRGNGMLPLLPGFTDPGTESWFRNM